jgi:hypothetical protein
MRKLKLFVLFSVVLLGSCVNSDQELKLSSQDPFFLTRDDQLVTCNGSVFSSLESAYDKMDSILNEFYDGRNFDYKNVNQNDLCDVLVTFQNSSPASLSNLGKQVFWINAYQAMTISLITFNYNQVLLPGLPDLPENRQILYIGDKGTRVFQEYKWNFIDGAFSLDQVEFDKLTPLSGVTGHLALYRGVKGFLAPYKTVFRENNIESRLDDLAYQYVNNEAFYDDFPGEETVFTGEIFKALSNSRAFTNDPKNRFSDVRSFFAYFLDTDLNDVLLKEDLTRMENGDYIWKFDFSTPINWQVNEIR